MSYPAIKELISHGAELRIKAPVKGKWIFLAGIYEGREATVVATSLSIEGCLEDLETRLHSDHEKP